jgi:hypothetical protein
LACNLWYRCLNRGLLPPSYYPTAARTPPGPHCSDGVRSFHAVRGPAELDSLAPPAACSMQMRYQIEFIRLVPHNGEPVVVETIIIEAAGLREAEARARPFREYQRTRDGGRFPHLAGSPQGRSSQMDTRRYSTALIVPAVQAGADLPGSGPATAKFAPQASAVTRNPAGTHHLAQGISLS